jgi:uncharacterized protein
MSVGKRIQEVLADRCGQLRVSDVRIGLGYTAAQLEDNRTGVAYTMGRDKFRGCSAFEGNKPLAGRPAADLLGFLASDNPIQSVLGLAVANALANDNPRTSIKGDVLNAVEIRPSDRVGMVGFFSPLVGVLRGKGIEVEIFEEQSALSEGLRRASEAATRLLSCQVAIITSTTIINNTIDGLLKAAEKCRETVLVGSSTPLVPEAFEGTPVTMLSGITVDDPDGILRAISEGRGTRFFGPFVTKWNVSLKH